MIMGSIYHWSSSTHAQYVALQQYFSNPIFPNLTHKIEKVEDY
jgi:hypothetical protein